MWRETRCEILSVDTSGISIHSLRVEGDPTHNCSLSHTLDFNPLPPCGGRHSGSTGNEVAHHISIHSLRVEGDMFPLLWLHWKRFQSTPSVWRETGENHAVCIVYSISIHSLRVEGDAVVLLQFLVHVEFQSTPSVWRETRFPVRTVPLPLNFNPLPPCGGRQRPLLRVQQQIHFNPLPPCGGRPGSSSGT